jgi:CrcB protein
MVLVTDVFPARLLLRPFLGVGVLGGFTTFSTYVVEILDRLEAGAVGTALAYLGGTVLAALGATWAGLAVTRAAVQSARRHRAAVVADGAR